MFWCLTPAEIVLVLDSYADDLAQRAKMRRAEIYNLAALVRVGFHAPKDFPKAREFISGERRRKRFSTDAEIKAWALAYGRKKQEG